jgi:hypothetical protein
VQSHKFYLFRAYPLAPEDIEFTFASGDAPLKIIETIEVLLVNNCAFALGKAYFAERVAELPFAIPHHWPRENPINPIRNTDC